MTAFGAIPPATDVPVIGGASGTRELWGQIGPTGTISIAGSGGWTVASPSAGVYNVTFTNGFTSVSTYIGDGNDTTGAGIVGCSNTSATVMQIQHLNSAGAATNATINFRVIGN